MAESERVPNVSCDLRALSWLLLLLAPQPMLLPLLLFDLCKMQISSMTHFDKYSARVYSVFFFFFSAFAFFHSSLRCCCLCKRHRGLRGSAILCDKRLRPSKIDITNDIKIYFRMSRMAASEFFKTQ